MTLQEANFASLGSQTMDIPIAFVLQQPMAISEVTLTIQVAYDTFGSRLSQFRQIDYEYGIYQQYLILFLLLTAHGNLGIHLDILGSRYEADYASLGSQAIDIPKPFVL